MCVIRKYFEICLSGKMRYIFFPSLGLVYQRRVTYMYKLFTESMKFCYILCCQSLPFRRL